LNAADQCIALAEHIFHHLRGEWTRLSWVLEFRRLLLARRDDVQLWQDVLSLASGASQVAIAIGASMLLAEAVLGECIPPAIKEWALECVPPPVRVWIERYGETVLLSEFPGTKLYLLLETAIAEDPAKVKVFRLSRLFPLHGTKSIVHGAPAKDSFRLRARKIHSRLSFTIFRLRFHIVQGVRYLLEEQRWKRISALPQS